MSASPYHDWSREDVRTLQRRVQTMISRGVVKSVDDALKMQLLNLEMLDGFKPTKVEHWHPYGFTSVPKDGAEVMGLALGGNQDHLVIIGTADRRYRLKGLEGGELAIHDDQGQKVHFKRSAVFVETSKKVVAKAPMVLVGDDDEGLPKVLTEAGPSSVLRAKV